MTRQEFELIARLLKSKEPVISAVGLVLFNDMANADAARTVGCTPQAVHRSTKRFLALYKEICETFKMSLV
jgi:hypothetical protein